MFPSQTAITFIAHGSSRNEANIFIQELIANQNLGDLTNIGFLEAASPNIPQALEDQMKRGATTIRVIPLFLVPGNHTQRDIPAILNEFGKKHPVIKIILEDFLGNREEFVELIKKIAK